MANYYPPNLLWRLCVLYGFYLVAAVIVGAAMVLLIRLARMR